MKPQQVSATLMVAILVFGTMTAIGLVTPRTFMQSASAQGTNATIATSADSHGGAFFGGAVQVVVTDPDSDDDDTIETIDVDIDANPDTGATDSDTFTISETSASSSKFEFYLAHTGSPITAASIDPINSAGVATHPPGGDEASLIIFGVAGFCPDCGQFEDGTSFDITAGDETVTIDYDTTTAQLTVDRDNEEYGSTSIMRLTINDQDGNINPTGADDYNFTGTELALLFDIQNGEFAGSAEFEESGDNTGIFEAELQLTEVDDGDHNDFVIEGDDSTVEITLNDGDDYVDDGVVGDLNETDSTSTSDLSILINNVDGEISDFTAVTFGSELLFTVTDNDQNFDSEDDDTITGALTVSTDNDEDVETFDLDETDSNTGIFAVDSTNDEVKITFCSAVDIDAATCPDPGNGIIELTRDTTATDTDNTIVEDLSINYTDPISDSETDESFIQTVSVTLARPTVTLPDTVGINDDFTVTLADGNLNDNSKTRDSYTITLSGVSTNEAILRGGESIGHLIDVDVEVEGEAVNFAIPITETLTETGINTGIFEVTFDMEDIITSPATDLELDDGDQVEFTFDDKFDDQSHESSDDLSIGRADTAVDFSRTVAPIPPEAGSSVEEELGDKVFVTLIIDDPDENEQSNTEDTIDFTFGTAPVGGEPRFTVSIDADGTTNDETIETNAQYAGSLLEDILPGLTSLELSETGKTTGTFDEELEFENGGLDISDWQDLEVSITYIDSAGDEEESGITFRGNDGVVDVSADIITNGATITASVQDEDLNLDDGTEEQFTSVNTPTGTFLLAVETDDDDLCSDLSQCPTTETFRETGADTGIFTATYVVGSDIPITEDDGEEIVQASLIRFTYNDEVDSGGGSGDEIEVEVPVTTGTGAISVAPELVGPGTTITVTVIDTDLNKDAGSSDDYTPDDPSGDDFFVSFRSDRDEVNEASPDLEETGANTGIFTFEIELITDASACADDDLDEARFDATGGSSPSIGACPGDVIQIRYDDEVTQSGRSGTVSEIVEIASFDPEFATDKGSYAVGDKIIVSISDPDANQDPDIADSLRDIRVSSDSDRVGEEVSAIETGPDTGVFRMTIQTASSSSGGAVVVKTGDTVMLEYTDEFPADFVDQEEDKDFEFTIAIGVGNRSTDSTTVSAPVAQTPTGQPAGDINIGQQVVLSTTVVNSADGAQPFVALVEVRDSNDVTTSLAWQTGTLSAGGRADVGLSWTPNDSGNYKVRTFVISSLNNPQILSKVSESTITVT